MARLVSVSKRAVLALAVAAGAFAAPLALAADGRYIVAFKNGTSAAALAEITRLGGRVVLDLSEANAAAVRLSPAALAALKASPNIASVEADGVRSIMGQRSGKAAVASTEQVPYGITAVQADQLPDTFAADRKLCIVDSGYDVSHEDLAGNIVSGKSFAVDGGDWNTDQVSHGTHVGGTISAIGGNGVGVVGVMPNKHIKLIISKVFGSQGSASTSVILKAVLYCAARGANVISMSLGGTQSFGFEQKVYDSVAARGILIIAAAGNSGDSTPNYPASYESVMSVAAVDSNNQWATFSTFNPDVEISGPGVNVLSTVPLGSQTGGSVVVGDTSYSVQAMTGSPRTTATGPLADFGLGDTPVAGSMTGKICVISRGNISFADKVTNCQTSGGIGAIIYNNTTGDLLGTLGTTVTSIPSVGALQSDGPALLAQAGQNGTVSVFGTNDLYAYYSGTSMATPHVSGVAALVWSYFPSCPASAIRNALNATALDLGDPGRDVKTGYGLVQAKAAYDYLKTNGCAAN